MILKEVPESSRNYLIELVAALLQTDEEEVIPNP
jgi:hypothetical protein